MRRLAIALLAATLVVSGACGGQTPAEEKVEKAAKDPEPKSCSDYASGQEVLADEVNGKLTKADKKNMDSDGDGRLCDEKGVEWKDTRTYTEGLPPFEVAFVVDGDIPDLKTGEITIDISNVNKPDKYLLEAISWEAIKQVGAGTQTGYRAASFIYRDAETAKELDAFGVYVADQQAAEIMNREFREQGAEIDWYSGKVPAGGYVWTTTYY